MTLPDLTYQKTAYSRFVLKALEYFKNESR